MQKRKGPFHKSTLEMMNPRKIFLLFLLSVNRMFMRKTVNVQPRKDDQNGESKDVCLFCLSLKMPN